MFIEIKDVWKSYGDAEQKNDVLKGVNLGIEEGKICVIMGASGSGKSTLLNLIGGLDVIDKGEITVDGVNIAGMGYSKLVEYRRGYVGYIFQFYNLIANLNVKENIETASYLSREPLDTMELIELLGLKEHWRKFPSQLSGGQQQRCAIGRAVAKKPRLLLCDEPTGALDSASSRDILTLLENVNERYGTTVVMVTHNPLVAEMADMVVEVKDGCILNVRENAARKHAAELEW